MTWTGFGGVMLDLLSPWLISYVSPIFVATMLTGDTLMTVSFLGHDGSPSLRDVGLEPAAVGRKARGKGMNVTAQVKAEIKEIDLRLTSTSASPVWRRVDGCS